MKWGSRILNFVPKMGQLHQGTFIYAFGIIKNRFGGPKIGPLSFFKKIEKILTPHILGHNSLNFCPKVKCHTILESWDVGLHDYAKKNFKMFCPMRNKHLKIGYPRCHNLGVRTPIKKILSQKSLFFEYIFGSQKKILERTLLSHFSKAIFWKKHFREKL